MAIPTVLIAKNVKDARKKARAKLGKKYVIESVKRTSKHGLSQRQKIQVDYWKTKYYTIWYRKRK